MHGTGSAAMRELSGGFAALFASEPRLRRLVRNIVSQPYGFLNKQFKVAAPGAVIVDCGAQTMFAMHRRIRNGRGAFLLEPDHDLAVDCLQSGAIGAGRP